jgi:hypothetical protein
MESRRPGDAHHSVATDDGQESRALDLPRVSGRGEFHPPALSEPGVSLSTHRAPIVQPSGRTPNRQWANSPGWRRKTSTRNLRALAG